MGIHSVHGGTRYFGFSMIPGIPSIINKPNFRKLREPTYELWTVSDKTGPLPSGSKSKGKPLPQRGKHGDSPASTGQRNINVTWEKDVRKKSAQPEQSSQSKVSADKEIVVSDDETSEILTISDEETQTEASEVSHAQPLGSAGPTESKTANRKTANRKKRSPPSSRKNIFDEFDAAQRIVRESGRSPKKINEPGTPKRRASDSIASQRNQPGVNVRNINETVASMGKANETVVHVQSEIETVVPPARGKETVVPPARGKETVVTTQKGKVALVSTQRGSEAVVPTKRGKDTDPSPRKLSETRMSQQGHQLIMCDYASPRKRRPRVGTSLSVHELYESDQYSFDEQQPSPLPHTLNSFRHLQGLARSGESTDAEIISSDTREVQQIDSDDDDADTIIMSEFGSEEHASVCGEEAEKRTATTDDAKTQDKEMVIDLCEDTDQQDTDKGAQINKPKPRAKQTRQKKVCAQNKASKGAEIEKGKGSKQKSTKCKTKGKAQVKTKSTANKKEKAQIEASNQSNKETHSKQNVQHKDKPIDLIGESPSSNRDTDITDNAQTGESKNTGKTTLKIGIRCLVFNFSPIIW
jgi:hypothetical protein